MKTENIIQDIEDKRDIIYTTTSNSLPSEVDLRKYADEIENQGNTGSCVANATVSALELLCKKENIEINLSRLFLYYNLREPYENLHNKDKGSYLRDGFKLAKKFGICLEKDWNFDTTKVLEKPDKEAYAKALNYKVVKYQRINTHKVNESLNKRFNAGYAKDKSINQIKTALSNNIPVTIAIALGKTFFNLKNKKLNQMYYKGVQNDKIGGHAMLIVGYNSRGWIVENSWGKNWGDNGFCMISYDVLDRDAYDIWICTKFETTIKKPKPKKDYCTMFPEEWLGVDISPCCKLHDETCGTRTFFTCLKQKIGKFHATYITLGGALGCWVKYTKQMIKKI